MKISSKSRAAFCYYLTSYRQGRFTFDGGKNDYIVQYKVKGQSALQAFHVWDALGLSSFTDASGYNVIETRHPNILFAVLKAKGGVNFMIKQWAEDRAISYLPLMMFSKRQVKLCYPEIEDKYYVEDKDIETELKLPEWVVNAVEQQAKKLRKDLYGEEEINS